MKAPLMTRRARYGVIGTKRKVIECSNGNDAIEMVFRPVIIQNILD
jgi:hypothetical protein